QLLTVRAPFRSLGGLRPGLGLRTLRLFLSPPPRLRELTLARPRRVARPLGLLELTLLLLLDRLALALARLRRHLSQLALACLDLAPSPPAPLSHASFCLLGPLPLAPARLFHPGSHRLAHLIASAFHLLATPFHGLIHVLACALQRLAHLFLNWTAAPERLL